MQILSAFNTLFEGVLMNEHIESFLNHYIDLAIAPEYAVLLTGEWGSGKTFFIKNFLESKKDDKKIIKSHLQIQPSSQANIF